MTERASERRNPRRHIYTRVIASLLEMYGADAILFLIQKPPVLLMHVEKFRFQKKTPDSPGSALPHPSPAGNPLYFNYVAAGRARAQIDD